MNFMMTNIFKNNNQFSALKWLLLAAFFVTQTACVSNVSSQTKASDKDTTGVFDGSWTANVQKSATVQVLPGNWQANCNGNASTFNMKVNKGQIQFYAEGKTQSSYVNNKGEFRFDVPLFDKATASAGSSGQIGRASRTLIVYGSLKSAKGRITYGIAEFGNNGCTAVIKFTKKGAST